MPDDARPTPLSYESRPVAGSPRPLGRPHPRYPVALVDGLIVGGLLVLPIYPGMFVAHGGRVGTTTDCLLGVWAYGCGLGVGEDVTYAYPRSFLVVYAVLLVAGVWINHRVAAWRRRR